jgi:exportin-5
MQIWLRLLRNRTPDFSEIVEEFIGSLLELCSQRSIRYDMIPEESGDRSLMFLAADCDNATQRDIILQQYRQACVGIIEQIVRKVPIEAIKHILTEAASFFQVAKDQQIDPTTYTRISTSTLQADAYFTTVEAGTRGCLKWLAVHIDSNPEPNKATEQKGDEIRTTLSQWCQTSLNIPLPDPDMRKKLIAQIVSISCKVLPPGSPSALTILDSILSVHSQKIQASVQYSDASKELVETCAYAAQRMATVFADQFLPIYEQLESRIQGIIAEEGDDLQPAYFAFLIMIIHRASNLDAETRTEKLRRMILPVKSAWENPSLVNAATSYEAFCSLVGWDQFPQFLSSQNFHQAQDWSRHQLNEAGREFQANLLRQNEQVPIKLTKAILKATTDKLEEGSPVFEIACAIWAEVMPSILPNLLKFLNYATNFQNPERWSSLPPQIQGSMKRLLQDRFWQSGISNETRDAFVSRVNNSKDSFEGFGSTVRRTIRQIRVGSCDILLLFSKLGDAFFGISDLASPMSEAIYEGSHALSAHHFSVLITFSSQLINACPPHLRRQFLPPIIAKLFHHLRYKIESEWEAVNRRTDEASADDNLDDEMKNQSILRSMTYNGCYLLFVLLEKHRNGKDPRSRTVWSRLVLHPPPRFPSDLLANLRISRSRTEDKDGNLTTPSSSTPNNPDNLFTIITTSEAMLEPILLFASSALRVRDSHSVTCVLQVLRETVPHFREPGPVHTFICDTVFKAAITSLHEPYFVDQQRDLAALIVQIVNLDPQSAANILGSLPGLSQQPEKVRLAVERVVQHGPLSKTARAVVLDLLESIRGVSIHEMGRIGGPIRKSKGATRLLQQLEMQVDVPPHHHQGRRQGHGIGQGDELEGVAALMGGAEA